MNMLLPFLLDADTRRIDAAIDSSPVTRYSVTRYFLIE